MTTTLREVEAAYRGGRLQARWTGTFRLRVAERRIRRHEGRLTGPELAFLKAVRDELRDRGVELPPG